MIHCGCKRCKDPCSMYAGQDGRRDPYCLKCGWKPSKWTLELCAWYALAITAGVFLWKVVLFFAAAVFTIWLITAIGMGVAAIFGGDL